MNEIAREQLEHVMGLLAEIKPRNLLVISTRLHTLLEAAKPECQLISLDLKENHLDTLAEQLNRLVNSVDMVLIAEDMALLSKAQASQVIGQLRNILNAQIIALISNESPLGFNEMIGLGFKRESQEKDSATYTYDIANYNKKREWNNARFWANPQNFDRFRW